MKNSTPTCLEQKLFQTFYHKNNRLERVDSAVCRWSWEIAWLSSFSRVIYSLIFTPQVKFSSYQQSSADLKTSAQKKRLIESRKKKICFCFWDLNEPTLEWNVWRALTQVCHLSRIILFGRSHCNPKIYQYSNISIRYVPVIPSI